MALLDRIKDLIRSPVLDLNVKPISDRAGLVDFLHTRSSDVAQTALTGYLKTRLGQDYREYIRSPIFSEALTQAQHRMFFDCLSDLTVFSVSRLRKDRVNTDQRRFFAELLFRQAAIAALPDRKAATSVAGDTFVKRLQAVNWLTAHLGENAFVQSPSGLIAAAPDLKAAKKIDPHIVMNSVRFRWQDVRRQMQERMDTDALAEALAR